MLIYFHLVAIIVANLSCLHTSQNAFILVWCTSCAVTDCEFHKSSSTWYECIHMNDHTLQLLPPFHSLFAEAKFWVVVNYTNFKTLLWYNMWKITHCVGHILGAFEAKRWMNLTFLCVYILWVYLDHKIGPVVITKCKELNLEAYYAVWQFHAFLIIRML